MPAAPAPKEDAQPAPRKSQTMTRFSANEKEQMKTGNRTAYVALPKNLKARQGQTSRCPAPSEILTLQLSKDLKDLYNQQRGKYTVNAVPATTSPKLPLSKSVLTSKTATPSKQPPINATVENGVPLECKPDELAARKRARENAQHLTDAAVAKRPKSDKP
ncbi:hypothetical protein N7489_008231 [Penicillium chrysogenum]|uniref:uncharacterized protein n=1 Tax=Penicillium chrysogenum TaxID=5076 RepID=UPI00238B9E33|nr:uncharacterized protein N7489_008231 [Penicillium chrysogenum]KAJ5238140.1 hypothetical protein N7489_008231 [Penicillium chrysogenum]KAJ5278442.1 hypothetical protein N7524_004595 [Penicillium chrysogenum]KAJ5844822.1 hypothetical protein N7534_008491 [Penicillium rubens]